MAILSNRLFAKIAAGICGFVKDWYPIYNFHHFISSLCSNLIDFSQIFQIRIHISVKHNRI